MTSEQTVEGLSIDSLLWSYGILMLVSFSSVGVSEFLWWHCYGRLVLWNSSAGIGRMRWRRGVLLFLWEVFILLPDEALVVLRRR